MRQVGVAHEIKTLFMSWSNEDKHGHHFDLPLFFNMSQQLLAWPGLAWGLRAECVRNSTCHVNLRPPGLCRASFLALRPLTPLRL